MKPVVLSSGAVALVPLTVAERKAKSRAAKGVRRVVTVEMSEEEFAYLGRLYDLQKFAGSRTEFFRECLFVGGRFIACRGQGPNERQAICDMSRGRIRE